ncbi:MAG TPA: response regulator [Burkholderiales bacterium]|nr:response regulator [Burkholderiales bacterium]
MPWAAARWSSGIRSLANGARRATRADGILMVHANQKNPRASRPLSILIVDDEPDTLQTLAALLADAGYVVHTCQNPTFAIDAIRRFKPHVCVVDIVMPRKTGFSIAREVWALPLANRPVLIALSGVFTRPKDDIVAKSAGFDYLVRKGTEPSELLRIIDHVAGPQDPPAA